MLSLDLLRFIVALPFFIYASYSDWKERLVSTGVWFFLGLFALGFMLYQYHDLPGIIATISAAILFYEWFFEWEKKVYSYALLSISLLLFLYVLIVSVLNASTHLTPLLATIVLLALFRALYKFGLIKGRADARALMSIALLQPAYPLTLFGPFPLLIPKYVELVQVTFPFAFLSLLYTGIVFFAFLLGLGIVNLSRRDTGFPEMFMGYRTPLNEVEKHHVWLMERIVDGEHVLYLRPDEHNPKDIENLRKKGINKVWVQPKIPFVVFITVGLILAYLLGSPL